MKKAAERNRWLIERSNNGLRPLASSFGPDFTLYQTIHAVKIKENASTLVVEASRIV